MSNRYEVEQKFFCNNNDDLIYKVLNFNMKLVDVSYETDEYFTDIESEYIKSRTCLRIRRKNDKEMEITYKGKSDFLNNLYAKKECNIVQDIKNYDDLVELFKNLGFYRYVCVEKARKVYSMTKEDITYNIMIDDIKDLGSFAEFEIICDKNNIDIDILKDKLNKFIARFDSLKLKEAVLPYRDFVAREIYNRNVTRSFKRILVNIGDVIPKINKNGIKEALCENEAILNFKLINKIMSLGIEVIILYNNLSEDTLKYIYENVNLEEKYIFKNTTDLENISLNDTLIIKNDEKNTFSSLALVILNWYGKM